MTLFNLGLSGRFLTKKLEVFCWNLLLKVNCNGGRSSETFQGVCCSTISPLVAQLSPIARIFILVFLLSRGSYPSRKCSADLEVVTQTNVHLSVISSVQVNNIVSI